MNEDLIDHRLDTHEIRINSHSEKIDKLEQQQAAFAIQIESLCSDIKRLTSDIKDLTGVIKWFIGIMLTTFLGFFIYAVQSGYLNRRGDFMDIMSFIPEQLIILVATLNVLGFACKSIPNLDDRYIPIILLAIGIVFSVCLVGFNVTSVMQGILCWGVAIGANQTYKQFKQ